MKMKNPFKKQSNNLNKIEKSKKQNKTQQKFHAKFEYK